MAVGTESRPTDVGTMTEHEAERVERANASGRRSGEPTFQAAAPNLDTIDHGWREVAETALGLVRRFA
jgi:hypothetical protein